jgi:hypothetical protein
MTDESAWCYVLVVTRQWKVSKQEPVVCGGQEAVKTSLGAKATFRSQSDRDAIIGAQVTDGMEFSAVSRAAAHFRTQVNKQSDHLQVRRAHFQLVQTVIVSRRSAIDRGSDPKSKSPLRLSENERNWP